MIEMKGIGVISTGYRLDSNDIVDTIKSKINCDASIFLGDTRITTTITKKGERVIGTKLDPKIAEIVLKNNTYSGQTDILGTKYTTRYTRIVGENNKVIGVLFTQNYLEHIKLEKDHTVSSTVLNLIGADEPHHTYIRKV